MASDGEVSCTNDPNFAVIYSFLKVFGNIHNLEIPTIDKLQEWLENTQDVLDELRELHIRLLRRALKSLQINKWERALIKFCHQLGYHQEAWEIERFSYKKASVQVKLKVLKVLLEHQFSCHNKFKNAVNAIPSEDLRMDPVGSDKNGCVYWLQIDDDANLRLYRENQDEETWHLVARNREDLINVINQLKNNEECNVTIGSINEDSNSIDIVVESKAVKSCEDSNEEFLSPESESEPNSDDEAQKKVAEATNPIIESCEPPDKEIPIENELVSDAIEEPVMLVTGEGNGVECESSFIIGEEITEPIMYFWGEGSGFENTTGNTDISDRSNSPETNTVNTINNDEYTNQSNGTCAKVIPTTAVKKRKKIKKKIRRSKKKLILKPSTSDANIATMKQLDHSTTDEKKIIIPEVQETIENALLCENTTESLLQDNLEIGKICSTKVTFAKSTRKRGTNSPSVLKKYDKLNRKVKLKGNKNETKKSGKKKLNISEKRKSHVTCSEQEEETSFEQDIHHEKVPEADGDDTLPPKKIKLDKSDKEKDISAKQSVRKSRRSVKLKESHSVILKCDKLEYLGDDCSNIIIGDTDTSKSNLNSSIEKSNDISSRKTLKVNRTKIKKRKLSRQSLTHVKKSDNNDNDCNLDNDEQKEIKSLKRSLTESKNEMVKSESHSEVENDKPEEETKNLRHKHKKDMSSRKRVEAKLKKDSSSEDSEDEILQNIGKKNGNNVKKDRIKKKKGKDKAAVNKSPGPEGDTPVRQSRRIAQLKIREEADRRHMEEVALRELKIIHKKKIREGEEEWQASGCSSVDEKCGDLQRRRAGSWRSDTTPPASDSESDDHLFEHEEPDLDFNKSDHEFSPESELEHGEPIEPMRRARTLKDGIDDGFCVRCGKGEQPEWILLCDDCNAGYHASCLKPLLFLIPEGDWYCPPCKHEKLISALEGELAKFDDLVKTVEVNKIKLEQEAEQKKKDDKEKKENDDDKEEKEDEDEKEESDDKEDSSDWSSSSEDGAVYRLRERRQLPVSYRAREYDRIMSSAIKEEYVEPTSSAGNQGRGKDISTIIEAAEEEKLKAERDAIEQGLPVEMKKSKRKQRRKPKKLNSLEVPSEDDGETDEDFKDTGMESTSEDISSDADKESEINSHSSDSLPIRRSNRSEKKDRSRIIESPELKKKKGVFTDTSSECSDAKDWSNKSKVKRKQKKRHERSKFKKAKKKRGLTQYDAEGNVIRARVTYGGLSESEAENDWSPKHRTRQKKINYTEMPNTESEDEMHKSSGKHMPDSSDEFKMESDDSTDSDSYKKKRQGSAEPGISNDDMHKEAYKDLINKTAIVPLDRLPEEVTKAKTEALEALLQAQENEANEAVPVPQVIRGRGHRGGRGSRGMRGTNRGGVVRKLSSNVENTDDALSKLVGVKIKDLSQTAEALIKPNQAEREKKKLEKEARMAEKEARKQERIQKKEEKDKIKEQRAKEREDKRLARLAYQESKKQKKDTLPVPLQIGNYGVPVVRQPVRPEMQRMPNIYPGMNVMRHPREQYPQEQRFPPAPRLQVRPELRLMQPDLANVRAPHLQQPPPHVRLDHVRPGMREGTLSVAGSPQPFKPVSEEPSIITRMPHMMPQQYRNPMMYPPSNSPYAHPRGPQMYQMQQSHPGNHPQNMNPGVRHQYPPPGQGYYPPHMRGMPPRYPPTSGPPPLTGPSHGPGVRTPHLHGPPPPTVPSPTTRLPHGPPSQVGHPHGPTSQVGHPHGPTSQVGHPHGPTSQVGHPHGPMAPGGITHGPMALPGHQRGPTMHMHPQILPQVASSTNSQSGTSSSQPLTGSQPTSPPDNELITKIKSEIKTEPEFSRDNNSPPLTPTCPSPPKEDTPRINHPKIKHTENKDRRPRYPLGPYAPQYGPYGPYAPPANPSQASADQHSSGLLNLQSRIPNTSNAESHHGPPLSHHIPPHGMPHYMPPRSQHPNLKINPDQSRPPLHRPMNAPPHLDNRTRLSPHTSHGAMPPHLPHHQSIPNSPHFHPSQHAAPSHPSHMSHALRPHHPGATSSHPSQDRISPRQNEAHVPHYGAPPPHSSFSVHSGEELAQSDVRAHPSTSKDPAMQAQDMSNNRTTDKDDSTSKESINKPPVSNSPIPVANPQNIEIETSSKRPVDEEPKDKPLESSAENSECNIDNTSPQEPLPAFIKTEIDDSNSESPKPECHDPKQLDNTSIPIRKIDTQGRGALDNPSREEGSVFGGLVSYFSSQREDEMDN